MRTSNHLAEMQRRLARTCTGDVRTHHARRPARPRRTGTTGASTRVPRAHSRRAPGRDVSDLLDLRERCLELFKVTYKGGVAEVWLLGQRLLELPTAGAARPPTEGGGPPSAVAEPIRSARRWAAPAGAGQRATPRALRRGSLL